MTSLIDTTIIVDYLRGHPRAKGFVEEEFLLRRGIYVSVISYVEIYAGVRIGEGEVISRLFDNLMIVSIGTEIGKQAGRYLNTYGKSHGLEIADALIAATALVLDVKLATLNRKHFPMADIRVYIPY